MLTKILASTLIAGGVIYLYTGGNKASATNQHLHKQKHKGHPGLKDWNSFFFKW